MENKEAKNEAPISGVTLANNLTRDYRYYTVGTISEARVESQTPAAYRLGKRQDGVLVLQGAYHWHEGLSKQGCEWRDIPTVDL